MVELYTHFSNDRTLLEIAEVGRFEEFKINIYESEEPVSHFHFESLDGTVDGCLRLDKPEYFKHGKHQSELNSKDRKRMVKWLQAPHRFFGRYGLTDWQMICIYWDENNPNYIFNKDAEMPDYKLLR